MVMYSLLIIYCTCKSQGSPYNSAVVMLSVLYVSHIRLPVLLCRYFLCFSLCNTTKTSDLFYRKLTLCNINSPGLQQLLKCVTHRLPIFSLDDAFRSTLSQSRLSISWHIPSKNIIRVQRLGSIV